MATIMIIRGWRYSSVIGLLLVSDVVGLAI